MADLGFIHEISETTDVWNEQKGVLAHGLGSIFGIMA